MIHNGPPGNIYILSGTRNVPGEPIFDHFGTLPFAERWLGGIVNQTGDYLKKMMKERKVSVFPVLKEHRGSMISQAEHTIMILGDRVKVLTQ